MRRNRFLSASLVAVLGAASAVAAPPQSGIQAHVETVPELHRHAGPAGKYTLVETPRGLDCRAATLEEAAAMEQPRGASGELRIIKDAPASKTAGTGLTIVLRATPQLDGFPAAKNAFIAAAETWESIITSDITIVLDVDFGPKRFGQNYESGVIGSTDAQDIGSDDLYGTVRSRLISRTSDADERALYSMLPSGSSLPTDVGSQSYMIAASANFRALGLISSVANPDTEENQLGKPPSIGFNSAFAFDFDPSNGIDFDKTDFNAVVLHEIGHALGFESLVGLKELDSSAPNAFTVLDLFRFRPGVNMTTFPTATRILRSGGTQVFFAGDGEVQLSTGRLDGSGGDGWQASHWKEDNFTGFVIGLMDPAIADGERLTISENDLTAFNLLGYNFASASPITVGGLTADLDGDNLFVRGTGSSSAGPIVGATLSLLDSAGATLETYPTAALSIGQGGEFVLEFAGLSDVPAATRARIVLADDSGVLSAGAVADFSTASPGGPNTTKVKVKGSKLKLTGTGFNAQMQLELNGVAMNLPPGSKVNFTGKKATIALSSLTLRPGTNRLRLLFNGLHSNIILVTA